MANLAIKGHATRGREVIELLEMLGGKNSDCSGKNIYAVYSIPNNGYIYPYQYAHQKYPDDFIIFTLEEFLEKFPYKVGDKVSSKCLKNYKIEKIEWEVSNNRVIYKLQGIGWYSAEELQLYKEETMEEIKIDIPKGYEFAGVDDDKQQVVFAKIEPKYPKTYKECCKKMDYALKGETIIDYKASLLRSFQKLLVCRDAYWKIAGEAMGLNKPWEQDCNDRCFIICSNSRNIHIGEYHGDNNVILAFPTKEIRDAFYENFKDLIEECKELL